MILEVFIPGQIRSKQRPRFLRDKGFAYTPSQTRNYENHIKAVFTDKYPQHVPIDAKEPIELTMVANFSVPKSTSEKKKKLMLAGFIKPTKKPDADNILKQIDALNKIAFHDDSQITTVTITKKYSQIEGLYIKINTITNNQTEIIL